MTNSWPTLPHKRKHCGTVIPTPESTIVAEKARREQSQHKTPGSFFDNLSRVWLTPRALREFDHRARLQAAHIRPGLLKSRDRFISIKRFARQGGPDLSDLTSYPEPHSTPPSMSMSSSRSSTRRSRTRTSEILATDSADGARRSSAYEKNFKQHLEDNGIYDRGDPARQPSNIDEIRTRLRQSRRSLSPSQFSPDAFAHFQWANEEAKNEAGVMSGPFVIVAGNSVHPQRRETLFNNFDPLTDGSLVDPRPDLYDGCRPSDLDSRIRRELGSSIIPSTNNSYPCLPNFFLEGKGPDGALRVMKLQACYDGAFGARGMQALRSFVDAESALDNKAYTIAATFTGGDGSGMLNIYVIHPVLSRIPGRELAYHMTQVNSYAMTGDLDSFLKGATAFRNARDWAQEQRSLLVALANEKLSSGAALPDLGASQATGAIGNASDTSADELSHESTITSFSSTTSRGRKRTTSRPPSSRHDSKKRRQHSG